MRDLLKKASCTIPHHSLSPYTTVFLCQVYFRRPGKPLEVLLLRIPVTYNGGRRHYDRVKELADLDLLRHCIREYGSQKMHIVRVCAQEDKRQQLFSLDGEQVRAGLLLNPVNLHLQPTFLKSILTQPEPVAHAAMHTLTHSCLYDQTPHHCEACYFVVSAVGYFCARSGDPDCCCCLPAPDLGSCSECCLRLPERYLPKRCSQDGDGDGWDGLAAMAGEGPRLRHLLQLVDKDLEHLLQWSQQYCLSPDDLKQLLIHHHHHLATNIVFLTRFQVSCRTACTPCPSCPPSSPCVKK